MKIINCACPKCGKQTSEYDNDKWTCLYCGNKFVIKDEANTTIINNSSLNVSGSGLFNLEPNGLEPVAISEDMSKLVNQQTIIYASQSDYLNNWPWKIIIIIIFSCVIGLISLLFYEFKMVFMCFGLNLGIWITILVSIEKAQTKRFLERKEKFTSKLNLYEVHYRNMYHCPYCNAEYGQKTINDDDLQRLISWKLQYDEDPDIGVPPVEDRLDHCKECGKQFFIKDNKMYKIS